MRRWKKGEKTSQQIKIKTHYQEEGEAIFIEAGALSGGKGICAEYNLNIPGAQQGVSPAATECYGEPKEI